MQSSVKLQVSGMKNLWIIAIIFAFVAGCGEYKKIETTETKRGDILCVHKAGVKDSYGTEKRYNLGNKIYVGGEELKPEDYKNFSEDAASCELSPNESVLTMKILNVDYERGGTYLLKSENNQPVLTKIAPYDSKNEGEWSNDGRWLLFREYFVNVENGERREIKGWKDVPDYYSLAGVSPDLKTVVIYGEREDAFLRLKIIDAETGKIEEPKFAVAEYEWLVDKDHSPIYGGANFRWISNHFKWEKDASGKDKLIYPVAEAETRKKK